MNFTLPRLFRNPALSIFFFYFPCDFEIAGFNCKFWRQNFTAGNWSLSRRRSCHHIIAAGVNTSSTDLCNSAFRLGFFALLHIHYNMDIDFDEIIRRFAKLHIRRMKLANILTDWLKKPGMSTLGSWNWKNYSMPPDPLEACAFGARFAVNRSIFLLDPRLLIFEKTTWQSRIMVL